jgi:hypothetical protein
MASRAAPIPTTARFRVTRLSITASQGLGKINDIQIQRELSMTEARAGKRLAAQTSLDAGIRSWILLRRNSPGKRKAVDDVRDSIGRERRRTIHEMEMQMRRRGVPAVPKLAQHIPPLHALTGSPCARRPPSSRRIQSMAKRWPKQIQPFAERPLPLWAPLTPQHALIAPATPRRHRHSWQSQHASCHLGCPRPVPPPFSMLLG